MTIKKYLWVLLSLILIMGCESLEDTYSDYAGDGTIRYIGKCTDVSVAPGWKRLIVKWVNNVDPVVDKIKVCWQVDDQKDSILLAPNTVEYSISNLEDGNYYRRFFSDKYQKAYDEFQRGHEKEEQGCHARHNKENVDFSIMDEIAKKLPMSQVDRPAWDFNKLVETGFHKIQVEIAGSPLPMSFCIVAQKG